MGKKGTRKTSQKPVTYGSDDERAYENEKVPDRQARDFIYDEVDEFHANREKILLGSGANMEPAGFSSDEQEEVLGFDDSDSDMDDYSNKLSRLRSSKLQEEMASDLEDNDGDGLPSDKAWGQKKSKFYGADVEDERDLDLSGSETGAAELEEQEVIAMQKKMAEQLDEDDFGMEIFQTAKKQAEEDKTVSKEVITKDLSKLSKKEKLELLKQESPELLELIAEYKAKLTDVKEKYQPIVKLIKAGVIPRGRGADFVETKMKLYLNYCINISFYLMLKAKRLPVHNHPVVGRLVQFRNLIKQLDPVEVEMEPHINLLLQKIESGEEIKVVKTRPEISRRPLKRDRKTALSSAIRKKKLSELVSASDDSSSEDDDAPAPSGGRSRKRPKKVTEQYETMDEQEALAYYDMMKAGRSKGVVEQNPDSGDAGEEMGEQGEGHIEGEDEAVEGDGKRGITYQIEKNKGLTPHRKKEYRNPRVKHRMKFRKAKIRRKGQVREARTEMNRYGGELSGIRAGIKRGIKIKS